MIFFWLTSSGCEVSPPKKSSVVFLLTTDFFGKSPADVGGSNSPRFDSQPTGGGLYENGRKAGKARGARAEFWSRNRETNK